MTEIETETENTALIMIDWQQGFADLDYWGQRNNPEAEANGEALLANWRGKGAPVIHVHHDSTTPTSRLYPGHPGHAFIDFATPADDEAVYGKQVNSAFIGTALEADLGARGISKVVLCGISTDHCVNTTTRMAANLGFEVTIVSDACFAFERRLPDGRIFDADLVHDVALASLNGEFAKVCTTDQVIGGKCD